MPKVLLLKMKSIHIVYLNKKIEIDMGLQISLAQNYNKKIINIKKEHIWHKPSNQSGPSAIIILSSVSVSGPSSFFTWALLSTSTIICQRVSIDCLVLLLVIGPYIQADLGFSSVMAKTDVESALSTLVLTKTNVVKVFSTFVLDQPMLFFAIF